MSNGSTMRRIGSAAVAGAAALAVLAPAASAADRPSSAPAPVAAAEQSLGSKLTVKSYLQYLASRKTPEAKRTLKAFRALPKAKQQKFVGHLQNRKVYEALTASLKGTTRPGGRRAATPYNADVSFVKEVRVEAKGTIAGVNTRVSFAMSEEIFGIPVTTEKVSVQYLARGGRATKLLHGDATVTNVNAAVDIKGGGKPRLVRGAASISATWKATPRFASFGAALNKIQALDAGVQGYWRASLHNA
ncbi:hypothetical protein [Streptomyces sp. NPDC059649]|uniref:hypothetical protein n=1 Tax=Streptomyces sp. NPDC059649 TaxID=3346895 RepID=UPI0036BBC0BC